MNKKRWTSSFAAITKRTNILFGTFLCILLIQLSIPCLSQTHIGPERTPPKRSAYKTALWPVRFALKLPFQILRYTTKGLVISIDESGIIPKYREIFFNVTETIGVYPMPSLSPSAGFGGGLVFSYDDFLSPGMDLEVKTNLTTTSEHEAELSLKKPEWMNNRFYTSLSVKYGFDPDRDFHGVGFDSDKEHRANFSLRTVNTAVDFGTNLTPTIHVGGNLGYLWADNGSGESKNDPSIEEKLEGEEKWFEKEEVHARDKALSFLVPQLSLAHDNTKPSGRPHSGGREEFTVALYHELTGEDSRFIRYELQLSRYFHLFLERTLAARLRVEMNSSMGEGYEAPFFLLSQLGGSDTLRGYSTGRFSDKDSLLATLDYRFPLWRHPSPIDTYRMDCRLFMDAGRVFSDIFDEFTLRNMKLCGGFGLRFSSEENFIFRLEIAKSSEKLSYIFKQKVVF